MKDDHGLVVTYVWDIQPFNRDHSLVKIPTLLCIFQNKTSPLRKIISLPMSDNVIRVDDTTPLDSTKPQAVEWCHLYLELTKVS